ncbi:half-A-TPR repeat-containing protein [Phyllosticta citrichinensis]|uniref:mRNA 3'-end-processing protein RNA14 n=1 Tax=Phyllosticta citrichinensis TaxID=1130410 RepID=A0ABR1Y1Z5_9PEZI
MADMSAEMAFLQSLQSGDAAAYGNGEDNEQPEQTQPPVEDDDEDYDPSNLIPNEAPYDPEAAPQASEQPTPSQSASEAPSRVASANPDANQQVKPPRTMGGFVVDDEDDEEETPVAKQTTTQGAVGSVKGSSHTPERFVSQTPVNALPSSSSNVPIQNASAAQDQTGVSGVSNGASNGASHTATDPTSTDSPSNVNQSQQAQATAAASAPGNGAPATTFAPSTTARLPQDRIGILEDRVAEDPRGDIDSWLNLIGEYWRRDKLEEARATYQRFFKIFPTAAEQWVEYANMELQANNFYAVERIFNESLLQVPHLQLWATYLTYIRRRNNLINDVTGTARQTISQAYEFVLSSVGLDKDAGQLWQDYVEFVESGPGIVGGSTWQDQQKMDLLRKAYQRAICVPTDAVTALWKQYDRFEMGLNKVTGRKFLQEKSPAYMTARSSIVALENITRDLRRTTLPKLPPAPGFDGDSEYAKQVEIWKKWISWEKEDPLVLKDEDPAAFKSRVIFVYKQALMALRFWPAMWYEAADFCFQNGMEAEGKDFLDKGCEANPESCLLAFKRADRVEITTANEEGEDSIIRRGEQVREPYQKVLDALYALIKKTQARETEMINRVKETAQQNDGVEDDQEDDDDDDQEASPASKAKEAALQAQVEAIKKGNEAQIKLLSRTISFAWIALIRAMRRIQGKGKPGDKVGGFRQVFADARKAGRITSDVYVASALIEHHCYNDPAATKILERGMKLFPEDEEFALEYLKHLIAKNDITNARAVFKTTVSRMAQKPETLPKAKPIYAFFHEYESHYGELSQIQELEKRIAELFPEDPQLSHFSRRYSKPTFDPTAIRHIISPLTQARPKPPPAEAQQMLQPQPVQPIPQPQQQPLPINTSAAVGSPRPPPMPAQAQAIRDSPKRPFQPDDSDNDSVQPRKLARGESPLKGAAGRRLAAQGRNIQRDGSVNPQGGAGGPAAPLPRDITFLLSIIPPAHTYNSVRFVPERVVDVLRAVQLPPSWPPPQRPVPLGSIGGAGFPGPQPPPQQGFPGGFGGMGGGPPSWGQQQPGGMNGIYINPQFANSPVNGAAGNPYYR